MLRKAACFLLIASLAQALLFARPPIDPDEGLKHISWKDAGQAIGQTVFVSGKIVNVGSAGRINFLNFDHERPPGFVGIVFRENLDRFPGELKQLYENKYVEMRGLVTTYNDNPQMVIARSDQIRILDALPKTEILDKQPVTTWSADPNEIVVATFNVLNLFDEVDDPYHADEGTRTKPRDELDHLAATIRKVNADVIALQEVENRGYLERFVKVFLPDMGYEHVVHFEGNDGRGIDVCLLSRAPIGEVASRRHLTFTEPDGVKRRFNRDVPAITVLPPVGDPLEIWVVHLKSKASGADSSEPIRLAEATMVRKLLDQELEKNPSARIIVTGDFNDTIESASMKKILGSGPMAMWSLPTEDTPDSILDPEQAGWDPIDFITCSPALAKLYVEGSCQKMRAPAEIDGSDHDPVSARFRLK
ncbi:endonuclease/exonuclease/phosphatase family protein [Bythopirellula polymerisocia]|uniref:Endonuclease/Exonuclease/phosphatase family protein n=1 Tax=Bythopirellula polymerisocia TaxID=2528003 RepID=A0A5C6CUL0_9BACT|nr:endonuclease/exonuclease/phosphatase family protein [Bythopirellula polymerisocia]TWU28260.1 Endonuclease/Exonuclease/phosphatase family protein [Bythopirellula polymerisocia]